MSSETFKIVINKLRDIYCIKSMLLSALRRPCEINCTIHYLVRFVQKTITGRESTNLSDKFAFYKIRANAITMRFRIDNLKRVKCRANLA